MIRICFRDTELEIHFLFLAMLTLFACLEQTHYGWLGLLAGSIHELGHLVAVLASGSRPACIAFEWCGIRMQQKQTLLPFWREAWILLAGSSVNFLCFGLLYHTHGSFDRNVFALMHLCLGCINLLPLQALDGGKLLLLCLERVCFPDKALRICRTVQWLVLAGSLLVTLLLCIGGKANITLLLFCVYLWVAALSE